MITIFDNILVTLTLYFYASEVSVLIGPVIVIAQVILTLDATGNSTH